MAKKRITEVTRNGSDADFVPENYMLIDGAEGSAKMRMDLFGKASTIEELDEVKYEKPEDGIPKNDLDSSVQASLGKADSALQQHQSLDGYVNGITTDSTTSFIDSSTVVVGKNGKNLLTRTASALWTYIKGMADGVYAALGHTHSVKINGSTKTIAASGGTAVDLGTYLTSQDISGKLNVDGTNATSAGMSTAINKLAEDSEDFKDTDYIIGSNHSGGITDTSTFVRRTFSALFNRIKAKLDGVYAALSHTHTKSQITDFPTALSGFTDDLHSKLLYGEFLTASVSEGYWCKFLSLDDTSIGYNSFPAKIDVMGRERVMYTCMFRLNHNSTSSVTRAEYFSVGGTSQANQEDLIGYVKTDRHYDFYFLNKRSGSLRYKVTTTNGSFYNLFTHPSESTVVQQTAAPTGIVYFTNMFSTLAYKDGTNATGTWNIDISKNAATATSASGISIQEIGTTTPVDLDSYIADDGRVHYYCWSWTNKGNVAHSPSNDQPYTVEVFTVSAGLIGTFVIQKAYKRGSDEIYVRRKSDSTQAQWTSWKRIVYGDGSNASGTWGISITGNAATATNAEHASTSDKATAVVDYGGTAYTIKIGYRGDALRSATSLAAYTVVNGQNCIKDINVDDVTVGNATKWNGYKIVVGPYAGAADTIYFL